MNTLTKISTTPSQRRKKEQRIRENTGRLIGGLSGLALGGHFQPRIAALPALRRSPPLGLAATIATLGLGYYGGMRLGGKLMREPATPPSQDERTLGAMVGGLMGATTLQPWYREAAAASAERDARVSLAIQEATKRYAPEIKAVHEANTLRAWEYRQRRELAEKAGEVFKEAPPRYAPLPKPTANEIRAERALIDQVRDNWRDGRRAKVGLRRNLKYGGLATAGILGGAYAGSELLPRLLSRD